MDKNAIKKYAVWARNELIARVTQKAQQYGITAEEIIDSNADSINGKILSDIEKKQRQALIRKINAEGFDQVMEEVAYTWFNRFTALRFMEVNGYIPSHTRVFTNEEGKFQPQIMSDALSLDIAGIDKEIIYTYKNSNNDEALYKYLLIVQCNSLNEYLPKMFQKISDFTELLLPDYLLRDGSVIEQMIDLIPEEDWKNQVQIIGWLYQYYNTDPKALVDAKVKKGVKVSENELPAKTQIFTPDWVVRYMVENSLGRLWANQNENCIAKNNWKYYIEIEDDNKSCSTNVSLDDLMCIDPCSGSGHILCYLFDVLIQIYEEAGYTSRDAVEKIVSKNLWGLDVDERASQLAYFSIMMKARQYDRRFFSRNIQPNVYEIVESNEIDNEIISAFSAGDETLSCIVRDIKKSLMDAKEYGSTLYVKEYDWAMLYERLDKMRDDITLISIRAYEVLKPIFDVAMTLSQHYEVVVTNPPYLGNGDMNEKLSTYIQSEYAIAKSDLYSTFMIRCQKFLKPHGYQAMVTMQSWMNLGAFEELRRKICLSQDIVTLWHLDDTLLGIAYQTSAFVFAHNKSNEFCGTYFMSTKEDYSKHEDQMHECLKHSYFADQDAFLELSGCPIAYSLGKKCIDSYVSSEQMASVLTTREGMTTGSNDLFLRYWYEVDITKKGKKWFPYNKGGEYRKWYGNDEYFVDWENDGIKMRNFRDEKTGRVRSHNYNGEYGFRAGITWSAFSSRGATFRYSDDNFLFDSKGSKGFCENRLIPYILGFLNSKVGEKYLAYFAGAKDKKPGHIIALPYRYSDLYYDEVKELVEECIEIEKYDWDYRETSWNFQENLVVKKAASGLGLEAIVEEIIETYQKKFDRLLILEEEISKRFIEIYELEGEVTPVIDPNDITINVPCKSDVIKDFISYFVGCVFGRYSLNKIGLSYAGGDKIEISEYVDADNIIPISTDEYFQDDIVKLFENFLNNLFGKESLEQNLSFIANELGGKGSSKEIIRNYFLDSFYADHCAKYQKHPIYWMFDSGNKKGFRCLVYVHRYKSDTIARIRTDYVHELQSRYRTALSDLEQRIDRSAAGDRIKLTKELKNMQEQETELRLYEEKIHHLADQMISINLDDGVKVNYAKLQDVLAKIK